MSRLIVKNLPYKISENRLRALFSEFGELTDIQLKFTKDKKFRRFAFIGYRSKEDASAAQSFYNNSYIDTSQIEVKPSYNLNEAIAARPWSKHSKGSSAYEKTAKYKQHFAADKFESEKKMPEHLEKQEAVKNEQKRLKESIHKYYKSKDDRTSQKMIDVNLNSDRQDMHPPDNTSELLNELAVTTDFEAVKSKRFGDKGGLINRVHIKFHEDACQSRDIFKAKVSDLDGSVVSMDSKDDEVKKNTSVKDLRTIKLRGLPFDVNEEELREFFHPIQFESVRLIKNHKGNPSGIAFIDFFNESDASDAMKRNKDCIRNRYIELFIDQEVKLERNDNSPGLDRVHHEIKEDEMNLRQELHISDVAKSGRLFLRNLAYSCTENDIRNLLINYGSLTDVHLPKSTDRKQNVGFAFIKFAVPADAVRAANELDGTIFLGRIVHFLPGRKEQTTSSNFNRDNPKINPSMLTSYKKTATKRRKELCESAHNWNSLFLNQNAILDGIASKFDADKAKILDTEIDQSLAVRLALGETRLVSDTRSFLVSHGVCLESLSKPCKERSKTIIIVKNLPFGTKEEEIRDLFAKYGLVARLIIPPFGITALIEYATDIEAKNGFRKLAYSKFKNSPLYLEWAPVNVFDTNNKNSIQNVKGIDSSANEEEPLNTKSSLLQRTVFVKNLNFQTNEDRLREKFRKCGEPLSVLIPKKRISKKFNRKTSLGFGFIEYRNREDAERVIKDLQHCELDGHRLELEISISKQLSQAATLELPVNDKQCTSKIIVKNLPFEATKSELQQIFCVFGEIKSIRMPGKVGSRKQHRGFAFVEFVTKDDAKRAFAALHQSTHLYGRRLVLQWPEESQDINAVRRKTSSNFLSDRLSKKIKLDN